MSICGEMLTDTEELVSAWQLLGSVKTDNRLDARDSWLLAAESFGCDLQAISDATDDWLRSPRNPSAAICKRYRTRRTTGCSWTGSCATPTAITTTSVKTPTARRQLALVRNWGRFDLDLLDDWPDETARRLSSYGMYAPTRIEAIRDALRTKVEAARIAKQQSDRSRDANFEDRRIAALNTLTGIGPLGAERGA